MIVLGIDPGLANLGLGIIEGNARKARHLHHVCRNCYHISESPWPGISTATWANPFG